MTVSAGVDCELVMRRGFGAGVLRIHSIFGALHDVIVDAIFHVGRAVLDAEQPLRVGFVLGEEQFGRSLAIAASGCRTRC